MKVNLKNNIFKKVQLYPDNKKLRKYFVQIDVQFRNKLQFQIRELKRSSYASSFQKCWKLIQDLSGQSAKKKSIA